MESERLWALLLAVVCFLAGAAAGILFALSAGIDRRVEAGPFAAYEALLVQRFDLDGTRRQDLHYFLDSYHGEVENLKARKVRALEPELIQAGQTCLSRIRRYVIPREKLGEFDALCVGVAPSLDLSSPAGT
jgi:hypothetical protein